MKASQIPHFRRWRGDERLLWDERAERMETREILRSPIKGVLLTLGALGFVLLGGWMVTLEDTYRGLPVPVIGGAAALFGGACFVYGLRTLFDRTPGLVLRSDGFEDRSSGVAVGFVPWSDVRELAVVRVSGQRFIAVRVLNPNVYAERGAPMQQVARRANLRMFGTPITITSNALRISFDELLRLLEAGARQAQS